MKKKEIRQVDEHAMVVQSNEIVEANYRLTAAEQKVILNLIAQLDTTREDFEVGRISARSLSPATAGWLGMVRFPLGPDLRLQESRGWRRRLLVHRV